MGVVQLANLSVSLAGAGSGRIAEPRLCFVAGDGHHVTRTAAPSFSSQTSTLYAWDEAYFLNLQDSLSLQIVLEGFPLSSENGNGSSTRDQLLQWANGSLGQAKKIDIPRGYIKDGAGSPLAVGSVDLHSGSKAGKSREAELQNLQTGKSIGTVTLFLLPVSEEDGQMQESSTNTQDRSVQQPYANTQDRSVLAPAEAIESIPPATLERVRQVFEEFTKEAMQSAPFEDMEDNLDIMDTTDSYMSGQREDEVLERRFFYILEDRPLVKERTTQFMEKIWVEKEYVRELHLIEERQLPGHTEVLDSNLYILTPSHEKMPDTLRTAQDVVVEEEKAPQQALNSRRQQQSTMDRLQQSSENGLQENPENRLQQSSDNRLQQRSENRAVAAQPARSPDAQANAPTTYNPAAYNPASTASSTSKDQPSSGKHKQDTRDESVSFTRCSAGFSWLKRRLPGKKSKSRESDQPGKGVYQAAAGTRDELPADRQSGKTQIGHGGNTLKSSRTEPAAGQDGEQLPGSYQAGQSNGTSVEHHTLGVADTQKLGQSRRQAGDGLGSGNGVTRSGGDDTQVDMGSAENGVSAQMRNGSQMGNGSQKVATRSMAYDPEQLPVTPQQRQGGGQPGANMGVDGVVADMQATMQGAMANVLGQQGGAPQPNQIVSASVAKQPGAASGNSLANQPGTAENGDTLAQRGTSASMDSSYFTIVEERRITKERVERFIEHRIFECEYVFEVRYVGERALISKKPRELIKRELHVLG